MSCTSAGVISSSSAISAIACSGTHRKLLVDDVQRRQRHGPLARDSAGSSARIFSRSASVRIGIRSAVSSRSARQASQSVPVVSSVQVRGSVLTVQLGGDDVQTSQHGHHVGDQVALDDHAGRPRSG